LDNQAILEEVYNDGLPRQTFLSKIEEYLVENKVCPAGFAPKLAIIPAILALDSQQENEPSQPEEDEIAT
jgi:hypothetical protein